MGVGGTGCSDVGRNLSVPIFGFLVLKVFLENRVLAGHPAGVSG